MFQVILPKGEIAESIARKPLMWTVESGWQNKVMIMILILNMVNIKATASRYDATLRMFNAAIRRLNVINNGE